MTNKLKKHIKLSKIAASANKAKGNKHIEILSQLYNNPARFLEEIIQNTEDAYQKLNKNLEVYDICFHLNQNSLIVKHNAKVFDQDDLIAITTIGLTTKKDFTNINLIGKFGLGFKSVYSLCKNPQIHSANYHFEIQDFEVLNEVEPVYDPNYKTIIILPFKENIDAYNIVRKALENINYKNLLFCYLLSKIIIQTPTVEFCLQKTKLKAINSNLSIYSFKNNLYNNDEQFFLNAYSKEFAAAFRIEYQQDNYKFVKEKSNCLFVFFETLENVDLDFLLHGNFTTTPTREHVPFCNIKTPENIALLCKLSEWFYDLILLLKKLKILNSDFLKLLPAFNSEGFYSKSPINKHINSAIFELIDKNKILPGRNLKFYGTDELVFDSTLQLDEITNNKDIELLFSRKELLDKSLTSLLVQQNLNDTFLKKIKVIDINDFAYEIGKKPAFFHKKSIISNIKFLKLIANNQNLWLIGKSESYYSLREKPFILCKNNKIVAPYKNKKTNIFLHSKEKNSLNIVHSSLIEIPELKEFFKNLGLTDEQKNKDFYLTILPVFKNKNSTQNKNYNAWLRLINIYFNLTIDEQAEIKETLYVTPCLPVRAFPSNEIMLVKPQEAHFINDDTEHFLSTCFFIDQNLTKHLLKHSLDQTTFNNFFTQIGVNQLPSFIKNETHAKNLHALNLEATIAEKGLTVVETIICDFQLLGLKEFFAAPTLKKSNIIAKTISQNSPQGIISCSTYTQKFTQNFDAEYLIDLKQQKWLYDKNLIIRSIDEDFEIHSSYFDENINLNKISLLLNNNFFKVKATNDELNLLNELRANKPNIDNINKLTWKLISNKQNSENKFMVYKIPESTNTVLQSEKNTMSETNIHANIQMLGTIFNINSFSLKLHNIEAKKIAENYLLSVYTSSEYNIEFDESVFIFKIIRNNLLEEIYYVSAEKTTSAEFLFPNADNFLAFENIKIYFLAIDYTSEHTPLILVYDASFDNFKKLKNNVIVLKAI